VGRKTLTQSNLPSVPAADFSAWLRCRIDVESHCVIEQCKSPIRCDVVGKFGKLEKTQLGRSDSSDSGSFFLTRRTFLTTHCPNDSRDRPS